MADVPALSGCHTQVKSLNELKENVLEAIRFYLDETGTYTEKSLFIVVQ